MNIDIRLSLEFFDHPKVGKLERRLGLEAVVCLLKLWGWAAKNRPTGKLEGLDVEDVEFVARWKGSEGEFVATLLALRLLDEVDGCFAVHDWEEHQAYASKSEERSSKARKAAEARWNKTTGDTGCEADGMPVDAKSNAQCMLVDATSMQAHAVSNAPETRNQFNNITTPNGVVVDAVGVSPLPERDGQADESRQNASAGEEHAGQVAASSFPPEASAAHPPDSPPVCPLPSPAVSSSGCPPCPHERILAAYHEALPELPSVKVWDGTRKSHLQARWRERWKAGKYASQTDGVAYWTRLFRHVRTCDWLMGRVTGRDGRAFKASLGWIVRPENFAKLIEGRYDRQEVAA